MLSRTRMALFNILAPRLKDALVWDCFAGSGLLGIEVLSRGARHCVFLERDARHARIVRDNLEALSLKLQTTVIQGDTFALIRPGMPPLPQMPANLIFLDPPHAMIADNAGPFHAWLQRLPDTPLVGEDTMLCVGHPAESSIHEVNGLAIFDRREYGTVAFTLLTTGS